MTETDYLYEYFLKKSSSEKQMNNKKSGVNEPKSAKVKTGGKA